MNQTRVANIIVVGGPISAGKSTLVQKLDYPQVPEIDENDRLQKLLLKLLYKKERIANELIELYFLQTRIQRYKDYSQLLQTHVLDRSILESLWFAANTLSSTGFAHFERLWMNEVNDLFQNYGKPKLYLLLTINWETFKKRIFLRGRQVEIENFQKNMVYFQKHIQEYEQYMERIFNQFAIRYIKLKVDEIDAQVLAARVKMIIDEVLNE